MKIFCMLCGEGLQHIQKGSSQNEFAVEVCTACTSVATSRELNRTKIKGILNEISEKLIDFDETVELINEKVGLLHLLIKEAGSEK